MSVSAVLLYGSLARNDQSPESDTDLLLVTAEPKRRHLSVGHLSMFFYPWSKLCADAAQGDLFVCHLVNEGRPLYDPDRQLVDLRRCFKLRSDYRREIACATDLGWFLVRHASQLGSRLVGRRIIWCVRTILIARSAEGGQPVFAPHALVEVARSQMAGDLLRGRHKLLADASTLEKFRTFLYDETRPTYFQMQASAQEFVERFEATSNEVALQTLNQRKPQLATTYC